MKPGEDFCRLGNGFRRRQNGAVDQPDRQAERACGLEFRIRAPAAGVLGDDQIAAMPPQELEVAGEIKGAARDFNRDAGQGQRRLGRIDKAQKIVMVRLAGKDRQMQPSDGEKHPARCARESHGGGFEIGEARPVITGRRRPGWAHQPDQGPAGQGRRRMGVMAHLRGKRMRGVDQMRDLILAHPDGKPFGTAETAGSDRDGLGARRLCPTGIGQRGPDPVFRDQAGELARLGRAAKNQKVRGHG